MNVAYNMDCMAAMKEFPDKFFDLAVVDPPYGIDITKQRERERRRSAEAEPSEESLTQIGGCQLSRPKSTTPSTIKSHQMQSISLS